GRRARAAPPGPRTRRGPPPPPPAAGPSSSRSGRRARSCSSSAGRPASRSRALPGLRRRRRRPPRAGSTRASGRLCRRASCAPRAPQAGVRLAEALGPPRGPQATRLDLDHRAPPAGVNAGLREALEAVDAARLAELFHPQLDLEVSQAAEGGQELDLPRARRGTGRD